MSFYKCGHEKNVIFLNSNPLSISAYLDWVETTGYYGNKSQCFNCYCKKEKVKKQRISESPAQKLRKVLLEKEKVKKQ